MTVFLCLRLISTENVGMMGARSVICMGREGIAMEGAVTTVRQPSVPPPAPTPPPQPKK